MRHYYIYILDIIRTSDEPIVKDHIKKFNLSEYKVTYYKRPKITFSMKLKNLLCCLFFKEYYRNIFQFKCSFEQFLLRESECRNFYLDARLFYDFMRKSGYFENVNDTIFYSYWSNSKFMGLCLAKSKNNRLKIVCRAANYDLFNWRMKGGLQPYKKYMDKYLDKFYHVSKMCLDYYLNNFALNKETNKYCLSYLGVKDNGINPYEKKDVINIVSCSYITSVKRVNLLIDELSKITNIKVHWTHFGGGNLENEMKKYAKTKLPNNIKYEFRGNVDNKIIIDYYQHNSVDLFVLLSSSEGLPVCIMEALSFGIPVIATNAGGVSEAINSNNGLLLPIDFEPEMVSKYILNYNKMSNNEILKLRRNARKTYEKMFNAKINFANFSKSLLDLFNE